MLFWIQFAARYLPNSLVCFWLLMTDVRLSCENWPRAFHFSSQVRHPRHFARLEKKLRHTWECCTSYWLSEYLVKIYSCLQTEQSLIYRNLAAFNKSGSIWSLNFQVSVRNRINSRSHRKICSRLKQWLFLWITIYIRIIGDSLSSWSFEISGTLVNKNICS